MNDLISRQAAIKAIDDLPNCYNGYSDTYDKACIIGVIEELPSAQRKVLKYTGESICLNCWTRVCDGCLFEPMEGVQ